VLHDVPCPVLTIAHDRPYYSGSEPQFDHILCAVDLGPQSLPALEWASGFARGFEARLSLLHVIPELPPGVEDYYERDRDEPRVRAARDKVAELQEAAGTNALAIVVGGKMPEAVHQQVDELRTELLVIGRGRAAEGLFGPLHTHTYDLIRECPCPVVSV